MSLESSFFKQNSWLRMFFLHNVFKMSLCYFPDSDSDIWMRTFGRGTSGPWSQSGSWCGATRDLGQIGFGWVNRFRSGIRSRFRATRIGLCRIDDLKHKPNWIGQFILNIDLYINNKYLSIYKLLKQWMSNRKYLNR